jgi:hypothetical protein
MFGLRGQLQIDGSASKAVAAEERRSYDSIGRFFLGRPRPFVLRWRSDAGLHW